MSKVLFHRLKGIKAKFVTALLIFAVVPLLIAGTYGVYYSVNVLEDTTLHHLEYELSSKAEDIEKFLRSVHMDTLFLSKSIALKKLIDLNKSEGNNAFEHLRKRVEDEFMAFSKTHPYYYQIRYINEKGYEIIRVDYQKNISTAIPAGDLQYKGNRYYVAEAMKYSIDKCYVSQMDLNIERGVVEVPYKPVVRFATPVFDSLGRKKGIVIINLYASYLIQQMQSLNITKGGTTFLVDIEGLYISHLNSQRLEGESFNPGSIEDFKKGYSGSVVQSILSGNKGTMKTGKDIISYAPIFAGDNTSHRYWMLALVYPKGIIFAAISRLEVIFIIIGFVAVSFALVIGLLMAKRLTEPILKLHQGVEWIAEGDFEHRLDIKTGDEIEELSDRFNEMGEGLKASRQRMEKWNEELKREVEKRTNELEIEKSKLENILICATEGIVVADEEDKIIILNPAAESILGVKGSSMLGKDIFNCHKNPEKVRDVLGKRGGIYPSVMTTSIDSKLLEVGVSVINGDGGKKVASMMVIRDITERHKLLEDRMTMERQLFQADKLVSLGELSAGIAHEIGNPLAAIKTVIQAMDEDSPFKGAQRKYMKRILKEVDRLALFLKTFSAFANPGVRRSANCRIDHVLNDVIFLIKNEAVKRDVRIISKLDKSIPDVMMDSAHLKQIFMNLFLNAVQAMEHGGNISVSAIHQNPSSVKVFVSDNGPGIPEENINKIFDPFFTTKPTGTGLGLSIIHRIIKEHSGDIKVTSHFGNGTTFEITLPVKTKDMAQVLQS
ncbi:MAG: HAMP domain-containing protein [Deltaproteobacteria bacterium]|nr:HAMP domain-containing protein [Deltaproteobacteria bacterium]